MSDEATTEATAKSIPGGEEVYRALVGLLARSGLEYSGGFVQVDGFRVHYLDYGPRDSDMPPVVLMHGAGPGSGNWYSQIAVLRKTRRVIAMDSPLFGLSDLAEQDGHPTVSVARFLSRFLDVMGIEEADFVGLSFGGAVILTLAIDHPERVRRLVLVDSAGLGRGIPYAWRLVHAPWLGTLLFKPSRFVRDRVFEKWEVRNPEMPDKAAYSEYSFAVRIRPGRSVPMKEGMKRFTSWLGQRRRFSNDELRSVTPETLIMWGDDDRIFPLNHGERATRLIPNARLEVIEDAGHVCFWDQPETTNNLLVDFLNVD
jgi:4,5:9,10-diseco-3-hydroxy-5,9,17-trioxoandrosta-1(10),2-diene-4-oate hydrolase